MLVLTRRTGETIVIGDDIRITVMEIKARQTRFGVAAPSNVVVRRDDAHKKVRSERRFR